MDGMGGMGGRRRKVDNDKYYDLLVSHSRTTQLDLSNHLFLTLITNLRTIQSFSYSIFQFVNIIQGVNKDSNSSQIKKAYRKLALAHHPDRGGDEETFKEITTAFEILSDEEKRQIYDEYGEEGLRDGGGPSEAHDIFSAMFGGGGGPRGPKKGDDVKHVLKVSLEDLYKGKTSKLAIIRNRVCKACRGNGASKPEGVTICAICQGRGVQITLNQIGPGMVQQVQSPCRQCRGLGETILEQYRCTTCKGDKVTKEKKVLEVYVDKGMKHGQKITFTGEANANPGLVAGDVVVVLKQEPHGLFERKENHLIMKKEISLTDALCGFDFHIKQLDGRFLHVKVPTGACITPGAFKSIPGEGMPTWKNPMDRGYLFIKFSVNFPTELNEQQAALIEKILGPRTPLSSVPASADIEEVKMIDYQESQERQPHMNGSAYDEDEEDQPRVQCAQGQTNSVQFHH